MQSTSNHPLTPEQLIDKSGFGRRQWISLSLIFLILVTDGMDVTIVSHIFPSLRKEWDASLGDITFMVTGGFVGLGIGAVLAGRLADRFGRKTVTIAAILLFGITTIALATSPNIEMFMFWRILCSIGLGGAMPVILTLLADLVPTANRSQAIALIYAGVSLGTIGGATLAGVIIPSMGWQVLLVICGAAPLILIVPFAVSVPESPSWLVSRGAGRQAAHSLAQLHPTADLTRVNFSGSSPKTANDRGFSHLFSRASAITTLLIWTFAFIGIGLQLTISQYLPLLLQTDPKPGLTTEQSSLVVALYGAAGMAGSVVQGFLLRRHSRFAVIAGYLTISLLCLVAIGFYPTQNFDSLIILMTATGLALPAILGGTQNILAAQAYPARVRATGVGTASASGRVGTIAGGLIGGSLIGAGVGFSGFFLAATLPVAALLAVIGGLKVASRSADVNGRGDRGSAADADSREATSTNQAAPQG